MGHSFHPRFLPSLIPTFWSNESHSINEWLLFCRGYITGIYPGIICTHNKLFVSTPSTNHNFSPRNNVKHKCSGLNTDHLASQRKYKCQGASSTSKRFLTPGPRLPRAGFRPRTQSEKLGARAEELLRCIARGMFCGRILYCLPGMMCFALCVRLKQDQSRLDPIAWSLFSDARF